MTKPWFSTNRDGRTVADDLNGYLAWLLETWAKPFELSISTAYFNPGGFGLLAHNLGQVERVRILLGADPGRGYEPVWKDWDATYDGRARTLIEQEADVT